MFNLFPVLYGFRGNVENDTIFEILNYIMRKVTPIPIFNLASF